MRITYYLFVRSCFNKCVNLYIFNIFNSIIAPLIYICRFFLIKITFDSIQFLIQLWAFATSEDFLKISMSFRNPQSALLILHTIIFLVLSQVVVSGSVQADFQNIPNKHLIVYKAVLPKEFSEDITRLLKLEEALEAIWHTLEIK